MSKPVSRQSKTSGTKFYTFESNALDNVEGAGRPRNNPFSSNSKNQTVIRMRNYEKQMEAEESDVQGITYPRTQYLSPDDQGLLIDYGRKVNTGEYGELAKSSYMALVQDLSQNTNKADVVKDIVNLLRVVDTEVQKEKRGKPSDVQGAVMDLMYPKKSPASQSDTQYLRPQKPKKPSKFSDVQPSTLMTEMINAQTGNKPSTSSSMNDPPIDNTDVPPNEPITATERVSKEGARIAKVKSLVDKSEELAEKTRAISKSRSRPSSRDVSIAKEETPNIGSLDTSNLPDWEAPRTPPRTPNMAERTLIQAGMGLKKIQDPTDVTQFQDMGGGLLYTIGESLGKKKPTPSRPPYAKDVDSDVPQDQQNQLAIDNNQYHGANPYNISTKSMMEAEEKERRAYEVESNFYSDEYKMLADNLNIFEGGGTDVTGRGKGSQEDIDRFGSDLAPASWDISNPRGMAESMKQRNVSQARDGSINVTIGGVALDDNGVRRNVRNTGLSNEGMTAEQILEREIRGDINGGVRDNTESRLADRIGQSMMDNANSLMSAGSGIVSQIGGLIDQQRNGAGRDRSREGLFGGDDSPWGGGDGFGQDLSNPRTLNERFSNMGMRRQGDKIDKYINMKNKGMMYSNLMGKGVSDPSIQSIRDRKDDYIQPNGKHKGNSVNLIRQSNATSIRLNNMYMP